jgi:hypothetical protein
MPRLVRQVKSPVRVQLQLRHVLVAAACICGGLYGLSRELDEPAYPRAQIARDGERKILDEFELWSLHVCPRGIEEFSVQHDPWGNAYQLLCEAGSDRVTLAVVSLGSEDVGATDAVVTSRTFSR